MTGPPPPYFPQPFANTGAENNSRSASRSATQLPAGISLPEPAIYHPQVPNDGTYLPRQPAPHTSPQSSAPPPVRRNTRPPAPHPHPPSHIPPPGSVPPSSFPIPAVPGGYGAPSNPSGLVPPPSRPMPERATTTNAHNVQVMGYQNVAAPGISHQRSATAGRSHQDDGSSSYGNQAFEQSPDTTGNYARERGRTHLPFAGTGHISQQTSAPQPGLPCKLCKFPTRPGEHARLGGFCSEKHKWDWDDIQKQNQPQQNQNQSWQNPNQPQQNPNQPQQNQNQSWQNPNQLQQNPNQSWQSPNQPQQNQNQSWQNPTQPQQNPNQSRRMR